MPILGIYASQNYTRGLIVDYLVVAGGGGGGAYTGAGGGGAGGLRSTVTATGGGGSLETPLTLSLNTSYTVTVGAGGVGEIGTSYSTAGSNSTFSTITSTGGGRGAGYIQTITFYPATSGGSGGGGAYLTYQSGAAGTANQGYAGGNGAQAPSGDAGGGGGGAGVAGGLGGVNGGTGGNGVSTSISGSSVAYAGGGGGGKYSNNSGGAGGTGGGGAGSREVSAGTSGTVNTGGGGGGSGQTAIPATLAGGNGGSGIVIARYSGTTQRAYGGTVTTSGGNTIHTFNSSGVFYTGTTVPVLGSALWLDGSDASTFTFSSGTRVSEWRDKSGNARHMTQATSVSQPDRSATQNGLSAVYFNVSNAEYFMRNTSYNWANSAFTMLCVVRPLTGEYTAYLGQDGAGYLQLGQDASNPSILSISRISQATASSNLTLAQNTTGQITYKSAGVSSGNVTVQIYKNKTAASSTVTLGSLSTQAVTMIGGSRSDQAPGIFDNYGNGGYLCELLVYPSQLSDTDREAVENYLIAKWGVS